MVMSLSEKQVNGLMTKLNEGQKNFINSFIKQSKKDKWLEVLAKKKGIVINLDDRLEVNEDKIDDWVLEEVLDSGYGNRSYKCECGKSLRFQYIVRHTRDERVYKLGETCFENYTSLSTNVIKDIKIGFHKINDERDDIIRRFSNGETTDLEDYLKIEVPYEYIHQVKIGLPLSSKQIDKLNRKLEKEWEQRWERRRIEREREQQLLEEKRKREFEEKVTGFVHSLNHKQKKFVETLQRAQLEELYELMANGSTYFIHDSMLEGIEILEDIQQHKDLDLPLLREQINYLHKLQNARRLFIEEQKRKSILMTYEKLMKRHLNTLKEIRTKEELIPKGLKKDWETIQNSVLELKKGKEFNYGSWKTDLKNLIIPIKVEGDDFL